MNLDKQVRDLERKLNKISKIETARAYASAINKTAKLARTQVVRQVAKERKLPVRSVSKRVYIRRATSNRGYALISLYAKPVNAINTNFSTQKKGFKVAGKVVPRSFFAKSKGFGRHYIFQRKGYARLPIDMVTVPISDVLKRVSLPIIKDKMRTDFERLIKTEFNARIKGYVTRRS